MSNLIVQANLFLKEKKPLSRHNATILYNEASLEELMYIASCAKKYNNKEKVELCSIINVKSGNCSEDCKFCAQSAHNKTNINNYDLKKLTELENEFENTINENPIEYISFVSSGKKLNKVNFNDLVKVIEEKSRTHKVCSSLGLLNSEEVLLLAQSGLKRYHCNIETSKNYFNKICSTHSFEDKIKTIKLFQECNIEVCSGVLLGIGESVDDRLDAAFTLRDLNIKNIPMNFWIPIKGSPLFDKVEKIKPVDILRIISLYRIINPDANIKINGGRNENLRDLQSMIFAAGANGIMIGKLLTTSGRTIHDDITMLNDLDLIV